MILVENQAIFGYEPMAFSRKRVSLQGGRSSLALPAKAGVPDDVCPEGVSNHPTVGGCSPALHRTQCGASVGLEKASIPRNDTENGFYQPFLRIP
jgi:hypothetical protein